MSEHPDVIIQSINAAAAYAAVNLNFRKSVPPERSGGSRSEASVPRLTLSIDNCLFKLYNHADRKTNRVTVTLLIFRKQFYNKRSFVVAEVDDRRVVFIHRRLICFLVNVQSIFGRAVKQVERCFLIDLFA